MVSIGGFRSQYMSAQNQKLTTVIYNICSYKLYVNQGSQKQKLINITFGNLHICQTTFNNGKKYKYF